MHQAKWKDTVIAEGNNPIPLPAIRDDFLEKLKKTGRVQNLELDVLTKTNELKQVLMSARLEGQNVAGMNRDITERKRAEELLRISENRSRSLYNKTPAMLYSIDRNGRILAASDRWLEVFGYERSQVLGRKSLEFLTEESRHYAETVTLPEFFKTGYARDISYQFVKKNGEIMDSLLSANAEFDEKGRFIRSLAVLEDVTERKRAEQELRESHEQSQQLAARQNAVREEERVQIARAIHDRLGQELAVLKLDLSGLKSKLRKDQGALKVKARDLGKLANTMMQTVREITYELRPPLLDDLGLVAAIEWELDEAHKHSGVQCVLKVEPDEIKLQTDLSISLFRIFQEALTNTTRHAQATHVECALKLSPGLVELVIEDNGIGITPAQVANKKSYGLIGIRERAIQFGGEVQIMQPGKRGTRVRVEIPLVGREDQDD